MTKYNESCKQFSLNLLQIQTAGGVEAEAAGIDEALGG